MTVLEEEQLDKMLNEFKTVRAAGKRARGTVGRAPVVTCSRPFALGSGMCISGKVARLSKKKQKTDTPLCYPEYLHACSDT